MSPNTVMMSPARKGSSACGETKREVSGSESLCHPHPVGWLLPEGPHLHIHVGGVLPRVVVKCSHHGTGGSQTGRGDQLGGPCKGRGEDSGLSLDSPPHHLCTGGLLTPYALPPPLTVASEQRPKGTACPIPSPSLPDTGGPLTCTGLHRTF